MGTIRLGWLIASSAVLLVLSGVVRVEGLDPGGQRSDGGYIDTHMHLDGMYREPGGMVKDYEGAADNLVAMMDRLGVARALVMPPPQSPGQPGGYSYRDLLGAVRRHPRRLVLVGGGGELNPIIAGTEASAVTPALRAEFERRAEEIIRDGAKAFGEMTALHFSFTEWHPFMQMPPDHPLFLLLAEIAARHEVPIDLHVEAVPEDQPLPERLVGRSSRNPSRIRATIPGLERLLGHNRKARIVWQHAGWDNTGHMTTALLRRLLDAHPNLYLAIKARRQKWEPFRSDNSIADERVRIRPEWLKLIGDYPDRFMIGADEFIGIPGRTSRKGPPSFEDTWSILDQLPPDLRSKVGRENAARVYRLE